MSLRFYLALMSIGTLLCWVAWFFVITNTAPEEAGGMGMIFFYSSLFMALIGTVSVIGFTIRKKLVKNEDIVLRHVSHTFRQSVFIAGLAVITLYLKAHDLLSWWNLVLLVVLFAVLEGVVFTKRKFNNVDYV